MLSIDKRKPRTDRALFIIYIFLVGAGLMMIYTVGAPPEGYTGGIPQVLASPVGKQAIWLIISAVAWVGITYLVDRRNWSIVAYIIYGATIIMLLAVLVIGKEINGAKSWFAVAGFTFQPSELAKFGTCLAMATYLSQWKERINEFKVAAVGFGLWLLPSIIILGQPDLGSSVVFAGFLLVMYREGLAAMLFILGFFTAAILIIGILVPSSLLVLALLLLFMLLLSALAPKRRLLWVVACLTLGVAAYATYTMGYPGWTVAGLAVFALLPVSLHLIERNTKLLALGSAFLLWGSLLSVGANYGFNNVLRPHQQDRLKVWLTPDQVDARGAGYNVRQSKLAIAAGGFSGRGLMEGTMTKYDYVPEQLTDFIFSAVGEQQGFMGTFMVIILFLALLYRLSQLAERQRRTFDRAYIYGITGVLFVHVLVNVGMTMGLVPVIGIPLPFISKGGSSLLSFTIMLAVAAKLDRHREEV